MGKRKSAEMTIDKLSIQKKTSRTSKNPRSKLQTKKVHSVDSDSDEFIIEDEIVI